MQYGAQLVDTGSIRGGSRKCRNPHGSPWVWSRSSALATPNERVHELRDLGFVARHGRCDALEGQVPTNVDVGRRGTAGESLAAFPAIRGFGFRPTSHHLVYRRSF
jgi:hypothetical protein